MGERGGAYSLRGAFPEPKRVRDLAKIRRDTFGNLLELGGPAFRAEPAPSFSHVYDQSQLRCWPLAERVDHLDEHVGRTQDGGSDQFQPQLAFSGVGHEACA